MIAVVLFHAEVTGARGGFLGVSAFFTLSGFLITSLLVSEHRRSRGIGLTPVLGGRARRLLPAAFARARRRARCSARSPPTPTRCATCAATCSARSATSRTGGSSSTGVPTARSSRSRRPSLHFWSLAIEEQFYVVFPLLLLLGCKLFRGRMWPLAACIGAAAHRRRSRSRARSRPTRTASTTAPTPERPSCSSARCSRSCARRGPGPSGQAGRRRARAPPASPRSR